MSERIHTYDVASALWQGRRPYQEDTLLTDFHAGSGHGFAVLADGMGGASAGDLASRLVVIDAASHLKFLMQDAAALERRLSTELKAAIQTANGVIADRGKVDPQLRGMGATFLATVVFADRLYWASVGDSPLLLYREGVVSQLNADHSLGPMIDQMRARGEISAEDAAAHPDRNVLTSALIGDEIKQIDLREAPLVLERGDVVIACSDGLQSLSNDDIARLLQEAGGASSAELCAILLDAVKARDLPHQDNTSLVVIQLREPQAARGAAAQMTRAVSMPVQTERYDPSGTGKAPPGAAGGTVAPRGADGASQRGGEGNTQRKAAGNRSLVLPLIVAVLAAGALLYLVAGRGTVEPFADVVAVPDGETPAASPQTADTQPIASQGAATALADDPSGPDGRTAVAPETAEAAPGTPTEVPEAAEGASGAEAPEPAASDEAETPADVDPQDAAPDGPPDGEIVGPEDGPAAAPTE